MPPLNTTFSIKSWHEDDRPREKLMRKGKVALTNAELLAICLGSGSKDESAVDLAKRILAFTNHNWQDLGKLSIADLVKFKGIGNAKAVSIIAALEIGRRRANEPTNHKQLIESSASVFNLMQPIIGDLPHEEFWVIFLNNANKVLLKQQLSKGGITGTMVDARLVFKSAIALSAVGIILCHNHPSGKLQPSAADKMLTKKIKSAGEILDIKVLDHLIITEKNYFSFADENLM